MTDKTETKKAIAYASDIVLGATGELIPCAEQIARIESYARENGIEILATYQDEVYEEDPTARPGLRELCACKMDVDTILVDRAWAISRDWLVLRPFLRQLKDCGVRLESASMLWDCVSQMTRNFFRAKPVRVRTCTPLIEEKAAARSTVRKPAQLHFNGLRRRVTA